MSQSSPNFIQTSYIASIFNLNATIFYVVCNGYSVVCISPPLEL